MLENIRMRIADYLNHQPDVCWAHVCLWAIGYQSFSETFGRDGNWKSQYCFPGEAYCGKCDRNKEGTSVSPVDFKKNYLPLLTFWGRRCIMGIGGAKCQKIK